MTSLRIDFISDVACPWCVIGLRSLETALEALKSEVTADIHFQPFELNPDLGPEGENTAEHLARKFGPNPERFAAARQALKESGAKFGFTFNQSETGRIWNTFNAHRLLHWAGLEGRHRELKHALFKANFTDNAALNNPDVLAAAAQSAGLHETRTRAILSSDEYAAEVRQAQAQWRNAGINAVPSILFAQQYLVQGGQPPEVFERVIRKIIAGEARTAFA
jgi:predicted DsbA family dithiol-disulfide isomerase